MNERFIIVTTLHQSVVVWRELHGWLTLEKNHPEWIDRSRVYRSREGAEAALQGLKQKFPVGRLAQAAQVFDLDVVWHEGVLEWSILKGEQK